MNDESLSFRFIAGIAMFWVVILILSSLGVCLCLGIHLDSQSATVLSLLAIVLTILGTILTKAWRHFTHE